MKLVVVGGGTGGHISPAIAVAEAFEGLYRDAGITFVATPRPVDARMYGNRDNVRILDPPRVDRGFSDLVSFPFRALAAYRDASALLDELAPNVLFATGGYPSFFPVLAARRHGVPSAVHESNSVPGRANRVMSRFADVTMTGFRGAAAMLGRGAVYTGNPVRPSLERHDRGDALERLGLSSGRPTVLFMGGSQGAVAVNDLALGYPGGMDEVNIVIQSGVADYARVKDGTAGRKSVRVFDFVDDPSLLYSAADLAVARSGAMTVAELAWFRVPAIFIPYPYAAGDHQARNAGEVQECGGALVFRQDGLTPGDLWNVVMELLEDGVRIRRMREALAEFMPENPAVSIAKTLGRMASEVECSG